LCRGRPQRKGEAFAKGDKVTVKSNVRWWHDLTGTIDEVAAEGTTYSSFPYTVIFDDKYGKVLGFHEWELEALNDD
jgi:hypothetical protein